MPEKPDKKSLPSRSKHASLTETYCRRIKPVKGWVVDYFDTRMPNLSLRSTPPSGVYLHGRLAWRFGFRLNGKTGVFTIGHYPEWTADAALVKARKLQVMIDEGLDPRDSQQRRQAPATAAEAPIDTVAKMFKHYEPVLDAKSRRHREAISSYFDRFILPVWAERSVHSLMRREIADLLDGVRERNGPVAANRCGTAISAWLNFLVRDGILQASPAIGLRKSEEKPREVSLTVPQLVRVWQAAETIGGPAGRAVQLLICTAARRDEAFGLPRAEVDGDVWLLPANRNKSRRDFVTTLPPLAMAVLAACPDAGAYFFSRAGRGPIAGGYAHLKGQLDAALAQQGGEPMPAWVFHDIRRSVRTALSALKIDRDLAEKLLNHADTKLRRTYDRWEYVEEKKEALRCWNDHFAAALVAAKPAGSLNVLDREAAE